MLASTKISSPFTQICSSFTANFTLYFDYTYNAKEKDYESGFHYYGSRYYSSELSIWNSTDPMADKYPSLTPYNYCANNPIKLIDPNGEEIDGWQLEYDGKIRHINDDDYYFIDENLNSIKGDRLYSPNADSFIDIPSNILEIQKKSMDNYANIINYDGIDGMLIDFQGQSSYARKFFEFLSNNTKPEIEFSLLEYASKGKYALTTSFSENAELLGTQLIQNNDFYFYSITHDHSLGPYPSQGINVHGDIDIYKEVRKRCSEVKAYIYWKGDYYEYGE